MQSIEGTVDLMSAKNMQFRSGIEYYVTVVEACIVGNELKVCFELANAETGDITGHWVNEFTIGSQEYRDFILSVYAGDDSDVIAVKIEELLQFKVLCSSDKMADGHVILERISAVQTPLNSIWNRKHNND